MRWDDDMQYADALVARARLARRVLDRAVRRVLAVAAWNRMLAATPEPLPFYLAHGYDPNGWLAMQMRLQQRIAAEVAT